DALSEDIVARVADKMLGELEIQLADRDVRITYSRAARDWVAKKGYDKLYGARPMARVIDEHIKGKLVDELLFGRLEGGGSVHADEKDGELVFTFGEEWEATPAKLTESLSDPAV